METRATAPCSVTSSDPPPPAVTSSDPPPPAVTSGDPPPPSAKAEETEEARCLCGMMSLTRGAIAIGIFQLVIFFTAMPTVIVLVGEEYRLVINYTGLVFTAVFHVTCNALLIYGARYERRGMVNAWVGFHAGQLIFAVASLSYLVQVLSEKTDWRVIVGVCVGFTALLIVEGYFLSVGIRLSRRFAVRAVQVEAARELILAMFNLSQLNAHPTDPAVKQPPPAYSQPSTLLTQPDPANRTQNVHPTDPAVKQPPPAYSQQMQHPPHYEPPPDYCQQQPPQQQQQYLQQHPQQPQQQLPHGQKK